MKGHPLFKNVGPHLSGNLGGKAGLGDSHRDGKWTVPTVKGPFLNAPKPSVKKLTPLERALAQMPVKKQFYPSQKVPGNPGNKRSTRMEAGWGSASVGHGLQGVMMHPLPGKGATAHGTKRTRKI